MKTLVDAVEILRSSEKFRQWHPKPISAKGLHNYVMAERHYTPDELAELWAVSTETIRSIFREEPGVEAWKIRLKVQAGVRNPEDS